MLVNRNVREILDRDALVRVFDEVLWSLRRAGVRVSSAQAIEWLRAVDLLGLRRPTDLKHALVAIVAKDRAQVPVVERAFDRFFSGERLRGDLFARLGAQGVGAHEIEVVREALRAVDGARVRGEPGVAALFSRGAEFDRLLGLAGSAVEAQGGSVARGWLVERARSSLGMKRAKEALGPLRAALRDALGDERARAIVLLLEAELRAAETDVKGMVDARRRALDERERSRDERLETRLFQDLAGEELERVRRAVKLVGEKIAAAERVRRRHQARGSFDARGTVRDALRTFGIPVAPRFRRRRKGKPKLMLLCDVSDSVRGSTALLLALVRAAHTAFSGTRSFVFVRDVAETTELLAKEPTERALARIATGSVVSLRENSSYGRVLRLFVERHGRDLDKRTSVVVLGDGRTNWVDDGASLLDVIRARSRALVWLCPEPQSQWGIGDSAMGRFAPRCTEVLDASSVRALERAAQRLRRLQSRG